jgi:hypothetical protein
MAGLKEFGITPEHRKSYAPVREAMGLPGKEKYVKGKSVKKTGWVGTDE